LRSLHLGGTAIAGSLLLLVGLCGCSKSSSSPNSFNGASLYLADCASCHQPDGKGVPGTFPPLAGSAIATGDAARAIHIVKYGLTGRVVVAGKSYNGMMPAWSSQLSDAGIAAVITYVRSSWENRAGAVTAAQVGAISK
jgi:mono/diheme cytochrome c family protein